jgi:hypothetical protein
VQKPGIAVYRLVSRQLKAAKVSPMKGSLTSAFVFLIRRVHIIRVSSKNKSLTGKARPNRRGILPAVILFILADLSGSP